MDSVPEGPIFAEIRLTIRQVILPLVQAIYDESPSDVELFCADYFRDRLQNRENDLEDMNQQFPSCDEKLNQKKEENMNYQDKSVEFKEIDNFPTSAQGSASAPVLVRDKQAESVNLRGTSSWDTPSKIVEPIKSLAVLESAKCGIGDQLFPAENKIDNDAKLDDTAADLKDDSAFEDDSFNENQIVNEVKSDSTGEECLKSSQFFEEYTDEDVKILCNRFENLKTSEISDTLKVDGSTYTDSDIARTKDIKTCRKKLSPNSSFGFIPHLDEYKSEEELRIIDSEDSIAKNLKTQIEENNMIPRNISQPFHDLTDQINSTETDFNVKHQNVKEINDATQGQHNANITDLENKSDLISGSRNDFNKDKQGMMISNSSDKHDLDDIKSENNIHGKKTNELPFTSKVANGNSLGHFDTEVKRSEEAKRDVSRPMDPQQEIFPAKEKNESKFFDDDENDDGKSDQSEPQTIVDESWRRRWREDHPSLSNIISSQRRYPRLRGAHFPAHRRTTGEAGDVPHDRFYIPNGFINCRLRNQITSESAADVKESIYSRCQSDEISHKPNNAKLSDNSSERKTSCERISNANPQNIPYSWRKLCKQSHSSENIVPNSKESQVKLSERTNDFSNSEREEGISSLNNGEATSESGNNSPEEIFFETSDTIHEETNLGIQENSKENKLNQRDDNIKDASVESIHDQITKDHDTQQQTDLSTNSRDKSQSKEFLYSHNGFICDQSANEKDTEIENQKQSAIKDDIEIKESFKSLTYSGSLLNAQKDKAVNEHKDDRMKGEFGLNGARGDFVSSTNDANEQDIDSQNILMVADENTATDTQQDNESNGGISRECVEEAIERVIDQQKNESMDAYEDLSFSDSSYIESSDFSETDDLNLNDSMQDK